MTNTLEKIHDEEDFQLVSEINNPALEKLVDVYYFLKDGKKFRDATLLGQKDYDAMKNLLVEYFPGKFTLPGLEQVNPNLTPTNLANYQGFAMKSQFNKVYDFYYGQNKNLLKL